MPKIQARLLAIFFLLLAGVIWIVSRLLDGSTILLDTFSECFTVAGTIFGFFQAFPASLSPAAPNSNKQPTRKAISGWQLGIVSIAIVALLLSSISMIFSIRDVNLPSLSGATPGQTIMLNTGTVQTVMPGLSPILQQVAPNCNNPDGVSWNPPLPDTSLNCSNNGLLMEQAGTSYYAELDLLRVHNTTYNQAVFRVNVAVTFPDPHDPATWAALLVQTPQAQGVTGGYILRLNAQGIWELQVVKSGQTIPILQHGSVDIQPSQSTEIQITVNNGILHGSINNQVVVNQTEDLTGIPDPQAVSLIVERTGAASSPILFSNFKLYQ
jgi:hypothetical protein